MCCLWQNPFFWSSTHIWYYGFETFSFPHCDLLKRANFATCESFLLKKLSRFDPSSPLIHVNIARKNGKIAICQFNVIEFLSQSCKLLSNAIFREQNDTKEDSRCRILFPPNYLSRLKIIFIATKALLTFQFHSIIYVSHKKVLPLRFPCELKIFFHDFDSNLLRKRCAWCGAVE